MTEERELINQNHIYRFYNSIFIFISTPKSLYDISWSEQFFSEGYTNASRFPEVFQERNANLKEAITERISSSKSWQINIKPIIQLNQVKKSYYPREQLCDLKTLFAFCTVESQGTAHKEKDRT